MGVMVEGRWHDRGYDINASKGRFIRSETQFRNWVTPDGTPGVTANGGFKAELGRYHLYVSLACPWAHRTLIFRSLKGLAGIISCSVVHWYLGVDGWTFEDGPGVVPDLGSKPARATYMRSTRQRPPSIRDGSPCLSCGTSMAGSLVSNESWQR